MTNKDFTEIDIQALKEADECIEQGMDKWLISYGSIYPLFQLVQQKIKQLEERIQALEKKNPEVTEEEFYDRVVDETFEAITQQILREKESEDEKADD